MNHFQQRKKQKQLSTMCNTKLQENVQKLTRKCFSLSLMKTYDLVLLVPSVCDNTMHAFLQTFWRCWKLMFLCRIARINTARCCIKTSKWLFLVPLTLDLDANSDDSFRWGSLQNQVWHYFEVSKLEQKGFEVEIGDATGGIHSLSSNRRRDEQEQYAWRPQDDTARNPAELAINDSVVPSFPFSSVSLDFRNLLPSP